MTQTRSLSAIAQDIRAHWPRVSPYAAPYLDAMETLDSINDAYYYDSARGVVLYFLANAQTWRGPDAKRIKAELKSL